MMRNLSIALYVVVLLTCSLEASMAATIPIRNYIVHDKMIVSRFAITGTGGIFTIDAPETPIHGVNIIVPPGAIRMNCEMIVAWEKGEFQPPLQGEHSGITLLLDTPNITSYDQPLEILIPLHELDWPWIGVAGFSIDEEGRLEALATLSLDADRKYAKFITFRPLKMTWVYF